MVSKANDVPLLQRPHAVYHIYGPVDLMLYIGCSFNPRSRLRDHRRNNADTWWPLVRRHEIAWYPSAREAREVEAREIRQHLPLCNPVIPDANGKHVPVPDGRAGCRSLWDRLVTLADQRGETMAALVLRALEREELHLMRGES
jgi:predicted GIY-YIG superfamily endonuclease